MAEETKPKPTAGVEIVLTCSTTAIDGKLHAKGKTLKVPQAKADALLKSGVARLPGERAAKWQAPQRHVPQNEENADLRKALFAQGVQ